MDLKSIGMGLAFAFMWASAFTSTRVIVVAAPPLTALVIRFTLSAIIGILLARAMGQTWKLSRNEWRVLIIFGIMQNALYLGLNWIAMRTIEASAAAIIASMMPLMVAFLGWVWLDPVMGMVGAVVIGRWSWTLMRDTAAVLLDTTDEHVAEEIRELVEGPGDSRICDLHVWRVGPEAHAAIVSVVGGLDAQEVRRRLRPVHELRHLTVEVA